VPHERLRYTDTFDDPGLPGEMQTTVSLKKVSCGTEVNIVQEGIPEAIPPEACYLGWQEFLTFSRTSSKPRYRAEEEAWRPGGEDSPPRGWGRCTTSCSAT
jgi:hypothetical protein